MNKMRIRQLAGCQATTAADGTALRELLHPDREYPFSGRYSLAHAVIPPSQHSKRHRLGSSEVYYILSGHGIMHVDEQQTSVGEGDAVDIPPGSTQWLENIGDQPLAFLCIVDPAWSAEDEEVLE